MKRIACCIAIAMLYGQVCIEAQEGGKVAATKAFVVY